MMAAAGDSGRAKGQSINSASDIYPIYKESVILYGADRCGPNSKIKTRDYIQNVPDRTIE